MMTGRIFDLVNNQTLQAKNSCIGVETATLCALAFYGQGQLVLTIVIGSKSTNGLVPYHYFRRLVTSGQTLLIVEN
jgi:hypothetical protein